MNNLSRRKTLYISQNSLFIWPLAIIAAIGLATSSSSANAVATSSTITPAWEATAVLEQANDAPDSFSCEARPSPFLNTIAETLNSGNDMAETSRVGFKFDLSSIPINSTVTKVELYFDVIFPTTAQQTFRRADLPANTDCGNGDVFNALGDASNSTYATFNNWSAGEPQTLDLGAGAVAEVQQRLVNRDSFAIGITSSQDVYWSIFSSDYSNADLRPALIVSYTHNPTNPTDFAPSQVNANSITWSWMDRSLTETDNAVLNDNSQLVCDAGPMAGKDSPVTCTESGLQPNTAYTRHPNATDPEGDSDGPATTAFTAISTPTGINIGAIAADKIDVSADGQLANLLSGYSGVYFSEALTGHVSGWTQANAWTLNGLRANTKYTFQAMARNGDSLVTPWSGAISRYTLSAPASLTGDHAVNAWSNNRVVRFTNLAGWGSDGVQYYRYFLDHNPTHVFAGNEPTWSNALPACPAVGCAIIANELAITVPSDGSWYLHVQPYNGDGAANGDRTYGPYLYDGTAPSAPTAIYNTHGAANTIYTNNLNSLSATWSGVADSVSGLKEYQYAVGTTPGGTDIRPFTSATDNQLTASGLRLQNGVTYYITVRAVDQAGNRSSPVVSVAILANTNPPVIADRQRGDSTHRRMAGIKYNVDFSKAVTGPPLQFAEYTVYTLPKMGGRKVIGWTRIFSGGRDNYAANWSVNFAKLAEGNNYVSVRTTALDGLTAQRVDAFLVVKDTSPAPVIKGVVASTFAKRSGTAIVQILGRGFKPGAKVWVGKQPATKTAVNSRGLLTAIVPLKNLPLGHYNLRVVNPNGLEFTRPNRIYIVAG